MGLKQEFEDKIKGNQKSKTEGLTLQCPKEKGQMNN